MRGKQEKFMFSEEFLFESAEKRYERGDNMGALTMLNKRGEKYPPSADAWALYADVYESMELYSLAADAWFRFLDTCNEADFAEGYEGLAVAFMNMGNRIQSAYYYHRAMEDDGEAGEDDLDELASAFEEEVEQPRIRLVGEGAPDPETLREGLILLKEGDLETAKKRLAEIDETSSDYPSAMGLSAMCTLMLGDEEKAEAECRELLKDHPDNVQALTTYCAVLDARGNKKGAREAAERLAHVEADATDDLYRIATALCETGLDEDAFRILEELKKRLPFDDNVLYFHAVAAYHLGKLEESISSLERLTTVFPRKAVARYFLERMRKLRDGDGEKFTMSYYYRVPEEEYHTVADFLLAAADMDDREIAQLAGLEALGEFFRIAFDEMEGRDEKLQMLAVKVAVRTRSDDFLREVLLDCEGDDVVKLSILHGLTVRNEEDSFGTVFLNIYREFFTHEIRIGEEKKTALLKAFADVYSRFALIGEENEEKLCSAAEDVYATLQEADALDLLDHRAEIAAVICREARMQRVERSFAEICKLFDADRIFAQKILDYMI